MQKIFRVMIIIAMLITAYLLILAWRDDYADAPAVDAVPETSTSVGADIPATTCAAGDIPVSCRRWWWARADRAASRECA